MFLRVKKFYEYVYPKKKEDIEFVYHLLLQHKIHILTDKQRLKAVLISSGFRLWLRTFKIRLQLSTSSYANPYITFGIQIFAENNGNAQLLIMK